MTIALFLLAAVSPCVSPSLCPTRKELAQAVTRYSEEHLPLPQTSDDDFVTWAPSLILNLSDLVCGDAFPEASRSMSCKFTVRYPQGVSYQIATLTWRDDKWVVTALHTVFRKQ